MGQEKTEMNEQDYALEKDDLGADLSVGLKDSLVKELELHKDRLEQAKRAYDNYKTQWDLENEKYQILMTDDNLSRVEPVIKAELNARYNQIQKELLMYKYRQDKHMAEASLARYQTEIDSITKDIEATQSELDKLED